MPENCFCEAISTGVIRQPANTWSSFAFVIVALLVLGNVLSRRGQGGHSRNLINGNRTYAIIYATALLLIGLGSAFYHASLTFAGQFVDVFGMYLIGTFILVYNIGRLRPLTLASAVTFYVGLNAALAVALYRAPGFRRFAFALILLVALSLEFMGGRTRRALIRTRLLWAALGILLLAFVIWVLDVTRIACSPASWLQGHAMWHVLGAISSGLLYLYYRSETVEKIREQDG